MYRSAVLLFGILQFAAVAGAQAPADPASMREISVTGEAMTRLAPDTVRVTLVLQEPGKTAQEAVSAIEKTTALLKKSIEALKAGAVVAVRGEQLQAGAAPGAGMQAQRHLSVQTSQIARAGEIIDTALANGAKSASGVEYSVEGQKEAQLQVIKEASERAKEKAKLLADSLGVKLGSLLSASITEDPQGEILRQQMQLGKDFSQFSERELHVYAGLRFAIEDLK